MRYPLDKELRILQFNKLPLNANAYPLFNLFMQVAVSCKSDNDVGYLLNREDTSYDMAH